MKKLIFYIFCLGLFYPLNSTGQVLDKNELENKIDALVPELVNDSTPGLVVGIIQNGKLVFSKGYGMANLSYDIPNDPKMVYNIGSVSKQFLGYAFAMLHVRGDLNIDDPVGKYLDDWPEFKYTVTLRHLLTHTSGYREAYTMSGLAGRPIGIDRLSRKECLDVVRKQPALEFVPGSCWTYNSTAWVILAEILEKVTGQPADKWVETNILVPLGMNDTQIESYVGEVIHNNAESYDFDKGKGYTNRESNRAIFGAAEIYTSIPDLVKWINNFKTAEIGGKEVNDLFFTPFVLNDGSNTGYALGIYNDFYRGLRRFRHTGSHEAFATQLSYFPDQDLGIVTISNFGRKGWLATTKIADLLLEEYMVAPTKKEIRKFKISKKELEQFEGLYVSSLLNATITLTIADDTLTMNGNTKLTPILQNTFRNDKQDIQIQFNNRSKEKTQFVFADGKDETYSKVDKWSPDKKDLRPYEGDYWSDELETVYHLIIKGNNLTIQHRWFGEILLEPITNDFFKTNGGLYVKFNRNNNWDIINLSISSGRTLNVIFYREE